MEIYTKAEEKCQFITKWLPIMQSTIVMSVVILPPLIYSIICLLYGNFDTSTWFLALKMSTPFDTSNISGWYLSYILGSALFVPYITALECVLTSLVSSCFYLGAIREHCESMFQTLDSKIDQISSTEDTWRTKTVFDNVISFHVKITE